MGFVCLFLFLQYLLGASMFTTLVQHIHPVLGMHSSRAPSLLPLPAVCSRLAPCLSCRLTVSAWDKNVVSRGAQTGQASWVSETQVIGHHFCPQDALAGGNQMSHILAAMETKTVLSPPVGPSALCRQPDQSMLPAFPSLGLGCPTLPPASPQFTLRGGHCDVRD